jgi:hypothetical protein
MEGGMALKAYSWSSMQRSTVRGEAASRPSSQGIRRCLIGWVRAPFCSRKRQSAPRPATDFARTSAIAPEDLPGDAVAAEREYAIALAWLFML